jgi:hypothetical protein
MSGTYIHPNADLLPYHLRPEVRAAIEREHPTPPNNPLNDDFDNEFYGCEGMGGMRCYTGNKHS